MKFVSSSCPWLLLSSALWITPLQMVHAQGDPLSQEEPTAPPTSQFQGPESGFIVPIPEGTGSRINQDRVVDFDYCFSALRNADVNRNQRLNYNEFQNFAQDFGSATECMGPLSELPIELITVWNQLSCECLARGGTADCCLRDNANIPITGADPINDEFLVEEQQFLRQVCLRTDQAILTYCGPPPPPIIPPIPPAFVAVPMAAAARPGMIIGFIFLALLLLLPWRRRWFLVAGGKPDDSSESSEESADESEDGGGLRHVVTEEESPALESVPPVAAAPDVEEGDAAEPADDQRQLRSMGAEEDGEFGGTSFGRTIQEPEYEIEGEPKKFAYEQYEKPAEPENPMNLKPIPPKLTEAEDEPYDLEHYVPDGGIVDYEREGEWRYDADGGWTPQDRQGRVPIELNSQPYDRAVPVVAPPVDNRRDRHLDAYGDAAVFDVLDSQPVAAIAGGPALDMFDWVISSTLDTLDERGDDLQGSIHSSDESSRGSSR